MRDPGDLERPFGWYEAGLPAGERKKRGHFSTPPGLVEQILSACGYTPTVDLSRVRVLDPACGSGNFLAGAARCLATFGTRAGLSQRVLAALVSRNLWGCDPDPIACFLAEMQVRTVLEDQGIARKHLSRGLHIHQADGLALPWTPCVDLLLANPPYLAAKNSDLSGYQSVRRSGQADSYLLFLRLAFQAVRPGGWIGLVLPDPVLARANAARERARLLEEYTLHHLWHLADVFAAQVGAVVIVAQKSPPQHLHQVTWIRDRWRAREGPPRLIPQTGEGQRKPKAITSVSTTHGTT
ncbi:MAG: N-6 DNA methylase, partial [Chloroflexota bacterium]|nr:N-6 DNA methylase [Chloroflexota bacterium]